MTNKNLELRQRSRCYVRTTMRGLSWLVFAPVAWISLSESDGRTITNLTFVPQKLTWNDAVEACLVSGGRLVEPRDESTDIAVTNLLHQFAPVYSTFTVFIGLFASDLAAGIVRSATSCVIISYSNWLGGIVPHTATKQCSKKLVASGYWKAVRCEQTLRYVCEINTEIPCTYDVLTNTSLNVNDITLGRRTYEASPDDCKMLCENELLGDGRECWAINVHATINTCTLIFTSDPFMAKYTSLHSASSGDLFLRNCFNNTVGDPWNMNRPPNTATTVTGNCTDAGALASTQSPARSTSEGSPVSTTPTAKTFPPTDTSPKSSSPSTQVSSETSASGSSAQSSANVSPVTVPSIAQSPKSSSPSTQVSSENPASGSSAQSSANVSPVTLPSIAQSPKSLSSTQVSSETSASGSSAQSSANVSPVTVTSIVESPESSSSSTQVPSETMVFSVQSLPVMTMSSANESPATVTSSPQSSSTIVTSSPQRSPVSLSPEPHVSSAALGPTPVATPSTHMPKATRAATITSQRQTVTLVPVETKTLPAQELEDEDSAGTHTDTETFLWTTQAQQEPTFSVSHGTGMSEEETTSGLTEGTEGTADFTTVINSSISTWERRDSETRSCVCISTRPVDDRLFLEQLLASLTIEKSSLSSERRRYNTAVDDRWVTQLIGGVSLVVLVAVYAAMVALDVYNFRIRHNQWYIGHGKQDVSSAVKM